MEHINCLLDLLSPLGVYDLSGGTLNRSELDSYAAQLDLGLAQLEQTRREMSLATAEGLGLELVESLLPLKPASPTPELRRRALAALLRISGDSFTLAAINDTLAGCGINALAQESTQPGCVMVCFPDVAGVPQEFARLRAVLEEILPCHLEVTYVFWYQTWGELGRLLSSWDDPAVAGKTWYEVATWKP